jgi:hypothetical protein
MARLGLVEAIQSLREELAAAVTAGGQEALRFEVGEIELTFQVQVEKTGKGGVKFWVVELGGEIGNTTTHAVKVPLTPKSADGAPVLTGGSREIPEVPPVPAGP